MKENKINHRNWLKNNLPDNSIQLIIADPPYFNVKGGFDFVWDSIDDYLVDVKLWAAECKRLLSENGTLIWYGHALKIAYTQVVIDQHFELLNSLVWQKKECQTLRSHIPAMRRFAPITERILLYGNNEIPTYHQVLHDDNSYFQKVKKYLDDELDNAGLILGAASKLIGSVATHYFGFSQRTKKQFSFPSQHKYELLQSTGYFDKDYLILKMDYMKELNQLLKGRPFYDLNRRFFELSKMQSDVLVFSQESHITKKYKHVTQKPEGLTQFLIETCSRPGDMVLVPFAGSGTECAMAKKTGRKFIGFDLEKKYVDMANKRISEKCYTPEL